MATILFVDDDEMERYFAREILEPRGHRVLYAGDGETALRIFGTESIDVVVTDLAMPRLNGLRLIQQLLDKDPSVRVIAASGVNADQLDMAEDFGAVAVLKKPWDPRAFLDTLERILSEDRTRKHDIDEVWPTLYAGIELDEEGKVVRTTPHEVRPPDEELPPPPPPRKTPRLEPIDLGLEGLELEVEDVDSDPPEFEIETDEDDDAQP